MEVYNCKICLQQLRKQESNPCLLCESKTICRESASEACSSPDNLWRKENQSVGSLWILRKWKRWRQHWKPRKQAPCSVKRIGHHVSYQVAEDIWVGGRGMHDILHLNAAPRQHCEEGTGNWNKLWNGHQKSFLWKKSFASFIACVWVSNESNKWRVLWLLGLEAERWRHLPQSGFEGVLLPLGSHLSWEREWKGSKIINEWHPQPIFNHTITKLLTSVATWTCNRDFKSMLIDLEE